MTTTIAITESYEAPTVTFDDESDDVAVDAWVAWVVAGLAWGSALVYAYICRRQGGYPDIRLSWNGFRVACLR